MITKKHTRSFAAGEIAPEVHGRLDLTKFQSGLADCINFETLPHGPAQNRSGWEFVSEVKDSTKATRLIPFSYSTEQTYVIELGAGHLRWVTGGGMLLETGLAITGITQANPGVLTYTGTDPSNGDWMYLSSIVGMTELNGRFVKVANVNAGANTFELTSVYGGANIDTSTFGAWSSAGTAARVYTVANSYAEADLFNIHYAQSADVLSLAHPTYAPAQLSRAAAVSWTLANISFVPTIGTPGTPTATAGGPGGGTPVNHYYKTTALAADTLEESLGSAASAAANVDLSVAGNYVDVTTAAVSGAVRYNIYKLFNGLYGYIGQTQGAAFRDNNVTADVSQTPPEASTPFGSADNYPAAIGYFGGRRAFAGTNNKPQNYWMTRAGTESNLSYSIPTRDDDTIAQRILAREVNRIRHIVALTNMVLLTSGGEWKVTPSNSDILTPTSADPKQFSSEGAAQAQPILTGSSLIYAQDQGGRVRHIKYRWESSDFTSEDISVLAPHLFDGYTIVDIAYTKSPHKMVWCVRSDGALLGLTYLPEHDVVAWHQHTTDGLFKSVAAAREGSETALYAIIERTINGRTVKNIERKHSRAFTSQEDAFFVDCGLTYDGAATTSITGLWHLEGETVSVLADGAVHPQVVVTNGGITLEQAASVVHVGLPYTSKLKTLPLAVEADAAFGQGALKNVNKVYLRLRESGGIWAGPSYDSLREYKQRTNEPYGSPPALVNAVVSVVIDPKWGQEGQVCVQQTDPLPVTVSAMTLEVALGG